MKYRDFLYKFLSLFLMVFMLSAFVVFADNPASPFTPGDNIQDPGDPSTPGTGGNGCGPSDSNCYVTVSTALSDLAPATATNTIDNENFTQEWQWNTLGGGSGLKLSTTSTLNSNGQKLLEVTRNGTNDELDGGSDPTPTYAGYFSNTEAGVGFTYGIYAEADGSTDSVGVYGTANIVGVAGRGTGGTNSIGVGGYNTSGKGVWGYLNSGDSGYAIYAQNDNTTGTGYGLYSAVSGAKTTGVAGYFSATGATNNYSIITNAGNVGIGDSSPVSLFTVGNGDLFQVASDGSIDAITGYIQGSGTMSLTSANTTQTTTSSIFALNGNSLTSGTGMYLASSTLTSGSLVNLAVSGTAASNGQKGINISLSGANASASQATYGVYVDNSHTGSPALNYGVYSTVAGFGYGVYGSSGTYIGVYGTGAEGVRGEGTSGGVGVYGIGTSGPGIQGLSTTGIAGSFTINPATTNSIGEVIKIITSSSGTATNGIGGALNFYTETSDSSIYQSAGIASSWTNATTGTRTGDLEFFTTNSGSSTVKMTLLGGGNLGIGDTTPDYLLDVENTGTDGYLLAIHDSDGECLHDPEAGAETVTCSSDERLKTNIEDSGSVLDYLNGFRIRNYDVIASGDHMTGVIAQEVKENYPELVSVLPSGMYSVQLPNQWKLVKGIQELDLKLNDIEDFDEEGNSFGDKLRVWLADIGNGIQSIFAKEIKTEKLCIGETCVTEEQLQELLDNQNVENNNIVTVPEVIDDPVTDESGTIEQEIINEEVIEEQTQEQTNEPEEIINQEEQTNNNEENQSSN